MTRRQKRIFFNWLKKHNTLKEYRRNRFVFMREYKRHGWAYPFTYNAITVCDAVGAAFSWSHTPEGHIYWRDLNDIWMKEYRRIMRRML